MELWANLHNIVITVMDVLRAERFNATLEVEQGEFQTAVFTVISLQRKCAKKSKKLKRCSYGERRLSRSFKCHRFK